MAYETRLEALGDARIGLWDTVASAQRTGSLDSAMREIEATSLGELVESLPDLRAIGFNGATSAKIGRRTLGETNLALVDLPSSSPAHAAMTYAAKEQRWKSLQQFLSDPCDAGVAMPDSGAS